MNSLFLSATALQQQRSPPRPNSPAANIRVYFIDNTYREVRHLSTDTTVSELLYKLQQKDASVGRMNLYFVASGRRTVCERKLEESERPLAIVTESDGPGKLVAHPPGEKIPSKILPEEVEDVAGDVLRRGTLDKLSSNGKKWKPREFTLRPSTLAYQSGDKPARVLELVNCEKVVAGDGRSDAGETKRIFRVVMDTRTLTLRAATTSDRDVWVLSVAKSAAILKENRILEQACRAMRENNKRRMDSEIKGLFSLTQSLDSLLSFSCEARDVFLSHTTDCIDHGGGGQGGDEIDYEGVRDYVLGYEDPDVRQNMSEEEYAKVDGWLRRTAFPNIVNRMSFLTRLAQIYASKPRRSDSYSQYLD
ncbi:hypothetical protein FOZ63_011984 [Perkinsus olseni]|uniref:PH domain-containing protein n=1 Tax=Perkinsus olseni TaxID=32597 RepID=A0A7J6UMF4_PEROL|nr:hypothetical protein FOZ63_011984 [Perkinsus olseni]